MKKTFYSEYGKRWFDGTGALMGLLVLSPFFLLVAIAIKLVSPGGVFFRHVRVGRNEKTFRMIKFRTMREAAPGKGSQLTAAGDSRITPIGRWLRKTKVDELPQLLNVLKGEMSLVGPRPEVPEYTARYTERQRQVLRVRPGITGPAANNYIDEEKVLAGQSDKEAFYLETILPAKLEYDIAYCQRIHFYGDLQVMWQTVAKLFRRFASPEEPLMPAAEN